MGGIFQNLCCHKNLIYIMLHSFVKVADRYFFIHLTNILVIVSRINKLIFNNSFTCPSLTSCALVFLFAYACSFLELVLNIFWTQYFLLFSCFISLLWKCLIFQSPSWINIYQALYWYFSFSLQEILSFFLQEIQDLLALIYLRDISSERKLSGLISATVTAHCTAFQNLLSMTYSFHILSNLTTSSIQIFQSLALSHTACVTFVLPYSSTALHSLLITQSCF